MSAASIKFWKICLFFVSLASGNSPRHESSCRQGIRCRTLNEALARVARAVVAERVTQGGKLHLVRELSSTAPIAMFSPRNINSGSFSAHYLMADSTSPDALIGGYIDHTIWKPMDVTVAFERVNVARAMSTAASATPTW
jgi:hypothetical protein